MNEILNEYIVEYKQLIKLETLKKIDDFIDKLLENDDVKITLGGCVIQKINQTVFLTKE